MIGKPKGVAVISTPRPSSTTPPCGCWAASRYALSGLLDARMQKSQNDVLGAAGRLSPGGPVEAAGRAPVA